MERVRCMRISSYNTFPTAFCLRSKGVHSNSADWGDTMPTLWKKTIASRSNSYDLESWMPDAVVINLGVNDLYPPTSSESDVATAYVEFLREIRRCTHPSLLTESQWCSFCTRSSTSSYFLHRDNANKRI